MSVYLPTEGLQHRKPFGGYISTPLRAFGQQGLIIPLKLGFDDGVLIAPAAGIKATQWAFVTDEGSGVIRIGIPRCHPRNVMVCFLGASGSFVFSTFDTSGAPDGYVEITVDNSSAATFQAEGFVYIQPGFERSRMAVTNGSHPSPRRVPFNSRQTAEVGSPFGDLFIAPYSFVTDDVGEPVADSFMGPRGYAVDHSGVGVYALGDRFDEPVWLMPVCDGLFASRSAGGSTVNIVDGSNVAADPDEGTLTMLCMAPLTKNDRLRKIYQPTTQRAQKMTAPGGAGIVRSGIRDGVLVPFLINISAGAIVESTSFIPYGLSVSIAAGEVAFDIGMCPVESFFGAACTFASQAGLPFDLDELATHGVVKLTPGGSFWGYFLASGTKKR